MENKTKKKEMFRMVAHWKKDKDYYVVTLKLSGFVLELIQKFRCDGVGLYENKYTTDAALPVRNRTLVSKLITSSINVGDFVGCLWDVELIEKKERVMYVEDVPSIIRIRDRFRSLCSCMVKKAVEMDKEFIYTVYLVEDAKDAIH